MRQVKRWRYYCDYCKKSGGSKHHMEAHERGCTMNPNRKCEMCEFIEDESYPDLAEMVKIVKGAVCVRDDGWGEVWTMKDGYSEKLIIAELKKRTSCPACILAALRQSGAPFMFSSFDYKKEKQLFWGSYNDSVAQEQLFYSGCY